MSDIMLMGLAQKIAEDRTKELIEEYNDLDLTLKGKREVIENKLMFTFLEGYNLGKEKGERNE